VRGTVLDTIRRSKRGKLHYGREVIADWARSASGDELRVLDLGCGAGEDLINVAHAVRPRRSLLYGIETLPRAIERASARGIVVTTGDLEHDPLPFADASIDVVIANQVLEHTKELFWIAAEAGRVLRRQGLFIVGVPNLASLHNRLLFALGQQPTSIELLGPHVRGFTIPALRRFLNAGGVFEVRALAGAGFYPFRDGVARALARAWPGGAVSVFALARRTGVNRSFLDVLDGTMEATPFFTGYDARVNRPGQSSEVDRSSSAAGRRLSGSARTTTDRTRRNGGLNGS
jgi:SAM-dependent methyltransferase